MRIILCSVPEDASEDLARRLVDARLAACVHLFPAGRSVYRWEGRVQIEAEVTMMVKTDVEVVDRAVDWLTEAHPYEVPEVLVLDVDTQHSLARYVGWVREEASGVP